jgi:arylsulfatase A-like enzyme
MNRKNWILALLFTALAVGTILTIYQCKPKTNKKNNPNLLANNLEFILPKNADERFKQLVSKNELATHFKPDQVNIFYKKNPWIGRIKDNDISCHAVFTIDNSKIICKTTNPNARGLHFSIYHPFNGELTYSISIEKDHTKKNIFTKSFNSKFFFDGYIPFEKDIKGDVKILFETKGSGLGAWVNPRLNIIKENPKVFLVIVLDTLRCDHTSLYGYQRKTTPFLEKLAADGVVYNQAFTTTSWTLPAHVSLFSGKDLSEHGVVAPKDSIPEDYPLAAEIFQVEGFLTAAFTGGGFVEDSYGFYRGFQYYSNEPGNVFSMNSAERVFNHFKNYIKRFRGSDLFIFLHTYQMHAPYKAPRPYIEKINKHLEGNLFGISKFIQNKQEYFKPLEEAKRQQLIDLYDASILYADEALIGNVIDYLKQEGLYENAMIMVLSDHGEEFYDHGSWEHGHTLYNELIKIPLVIKFPFNTNKKGIEESLVSITDIPGMMLKESGCQYDGTHFKVQIGEPNRVLPVLFPVSPIIKQFSSKISFVNDEFHFIYNQVDREKLAFFNPAPGNIPVYELYERKDLKEKNNIYKTHFQKIIQFKDRVHLYLEKLKQLKRKQKGLDKDLEKKLKSIGYLDNK